MGNIWAFPHLLGNHASYMTLQLLHSEFHCIWGKFDFRFYQCRKTTVFYLGIRNIYWSFFKSFKDEDAYTEGPEASSHSEYLAEDGTECIHEARPVSGLCESECIHEARPVSGLCALECSRQKAGSVPGLCVQGHCEKVLNEQTSFREKGYVDKASFVIIILCT